ncbi:MAG: Carboxypeptidase 1 [Chlamydiia bacterium]|nr:Carboxypeptidase 1 [Chlamydiia bacterium]MCH9615968.1 Carboxypeptidase 1 [Chlamydiia bacterium]MCH9628629.1 Carboxypeptidase 1 [Chlamydiia bacterium]
MSNYEKTLSIAKRTQLLTSINSLVDWDRETFMPDGGADVRSLQCELLSELIHKEQTSKHFKSSLQTLIDLDTGEIVDPTLTDEQKAAAFEWRLDFLENSKLPTSFVQAFSKLTSKATHVWKNRDFSTFSPYLTDIIDMLRKKSDHLGYDDHPYDPHLNLYERGITTKELKELFGQLKPKLIKIVKALASHPSDTSCLNGHFNPDAQLKLCREIVRDMGLKDDFASLHLTTHPFCLSLHPHDVRLTTHIDRANFFQSISATVHEAGHGLYEHGFEQSHYGSPLCLPISFGMHESQSKWWEAFVGLSYPYCEYLTPKLHAAFPGLKDMSNETLYQAINHVEPSLIRIYADEVTYILHIILRFEIEVAFMEGTLEVKDLPEVWNQKMEESLGIRPKNNAEGCLQDVHWSAGLFGYFPSYALGILYASQMFDTYKSNNPNYVKDIQNGHFAPMVNFLRENIHKHGRRYTSSEIIKRITKRPLDTSSFESYLEDKYLSRLL